MKRPEALSPAEEAEVDRLVARGRNRIAARQKVVEDRFRSRSQRREEGGCRRPVSDSLNSYVNARLHAPDRKPEGSHEDENPLHARTNSLRGQD